MWLFSGQSKSHCRDFVALCFHNTWREWDSIKGRKLFERETGWTTDSDRVLPQSNWSHQEGLALEHLQLVNCLPAYLKEYGCLSSTLVLATVEELAGEAVTACPDLPWGRQSSGRLVEDLWRTEVSNWKDRQRLRKFFNLVKPVDFTH